MSQLQDSHSAAPWTADLQSPVQGCWSDPVGIATACPGSATFHAGFPSSPSLDPSPKAANLLRGKAGPQLRLCLQPWTASAAVRPGTAGGCVEMAPWVPRAFQKGPKGTAELNRAEHLTHPSGTPFAEVAGGSQPCHFPHPSPHAHTSNTRLTVNYSPASPQGCCRAPSPGAEEERSRKAH